VNDGQNLVLVFEDNGVGIPSSEKEMIFERGYGKNTGFGLFLIREILSITGLSIKENGIPGKGVRFEITVPQGVYRTIME
jgi:signal transduction histidine kinase